MDIDSPSTNPSPLPPGPRQPHDAGSSGNATPHLDSASAPPNKRKYDHLIQPNAASSPMPSEPSSPSAHPSSPPPPSSPPFPDRSASSTPAPPFTSEAQKVYIARTAPHLLGRPATQSGSNTLSLPPSGRSSPSDDDGRSTPDGNSSTPTPSNQSHHSLPEGYRGPALRKNDAEDFAPSPHLIPTTGSATLFNTVNFAVNRNGWRYTAAGPASQHLPQTLFKTLETLPPTVHWCWSDRSPFTKISADADIVSTDKGFRSARTNIGVREGEWYAEIEILPPEHLVPGVGAPGPLPLPMKDGSHVRLGWGRREAQLNAPVGFDGYSYGFRDKTGDKVTLSRPLPYGQPFKQGDVVGLYIKLPTPAAPQDEHDPANVRRERIPIRYKGQLYFESLEYPRTREMDQLMERSRKGNSIEEAHQGILGTGIFEPVDANATASTEASNGAAALNATGGGSGSAKVKNRKSTAAKDKPSGPTIPSLRPVPRIAGSKIGFFVNGVAQGIAFRDLFDFRPLRVKGFSNLNPNAAKSAAPRSGKGAGKPEVVEPVINVKARENVFDDGALGYFPFVSCYGSARARLITGHDGFRFPPPQDIEAALERATKSTATEAVEGVGEMEVEGKVGGGWRPIAERFEQHLAEMWAFDLQDEARAQAVAAKQAEEREKRNSAAKERYAAAKKKHAAALARQSAASPSPNPDSTMVDESPDPDATITLHRADDDVHACPDQVAAPQQSLVQIDVVREAELLLPPTDALLHHKDGSVSPARTLTPPLTSHAAETAQHDNDVDMHDAV